MVSLLQHGQGIVTCCSTAKVLLRNKDLGYAEIDVSPDAVREQDEDRALTAPVGAAVLHR